MSFLLDTQIFIWLASQPHRLSLPTRSVLRDPVNALYLSVASVWEMQIKVGIGKLTLPVSVRDFVEGQRMLENIRSLPVLEQHIWSLANLPLHHRDPFDRLLIAQAIAGSLTLVMEDPFFALYPIQILR